MVLGPFVIVHVRLEFREAESERPWVGACFHGPWCRAGVLGSLPCCQGVSRMRGGLRVVLGMLQCPGPAGLP